MKQYISLWQTQAQTSRDKNSHKMLRSSCNRVGEPRAERWLIVGPIIVTYSYLLQISNKYKLCPGHISIHIYGVLPLNHYCCGQQKISRLVVNDNTVTHNLPIVNNNMPLDMI